MIRENEKKYLYFRLFFIFGAFVIGVAVLWTDLILNELDADGIFLRVLFILIMSCIAFYIPTVYRILKKSSETYQKRKELRFLKKIFVMSGSVKPVDYMQVVNAMYERSAFYKNDLEQIMDVLRKSNVDKEEFFYELLYSTKDIDSKLFYEKLSIGFLYDFNLAVRSIGADFDQEKRAYARFIKKRVNFIHIVGITGLFIAMTIILIYMLKPWLSSMSLNII